MKKYTLVSGPILVIGIISLTTACQRQAAQIVCWEEPAARVAVGLVRADKYDGDRRTICAPVSARTRPAAVISTGSGSTTPLSNPSGGGTAPAAPPNGAPNTPEISRENVRAGPDGVTIEPASQGTGQPTVTAGGGLVSIIY